MKKVVLGMILLNQLVSGMDLPTSSEQEQQFNSPVSVNQQRNFQAMNFQNILAREEENHRREMEAKNAELEEARNEKIRVEKEKELLEQISRIFIANPSLKPDKMEKSEKINSLPDIFKKRAAVQAGYSKFAPFSSLLGREDFGISAKQSDLAKISEYLNNTRISPKPAEPTYIRGIRIGGFGGYLEYNRYKHIKNTERRNAYNNAMSAWNAEVARASSVAFPSEEFDSLVEQFNVFVSKIK